ncbi:3-dehydroquinate synthase [Marinicella gelatinilytica]|uniref:3-dehydroquinate synthase n=1 Tax=Marinicella gelatinilytica TaxID=2996017 RepID=UPI00226084D1|nr:3-dehydroquinate synthase [Marinicella gelatinilytica]MCX7544169.1 3-dehydroquinate synthase [Marinicella gelatinilytica]
MQKLSLDIPGKQYPIIIDQEAFNLAEIRSRLTAQKVMLVSDEHVAPLYLEPLRTELDGFEVHECVIAAGENHKNTHSWQKILNALAAHGFNRSDVLVAVGGGIVCDITGFAAASWMRGVDFVQVPTSLLAQIDASVGGKTGVNHAAGKNLIGAFHQPRAVLINIATLQTLPAREFNAGIGEAIKYAGINQPEFFTWLHDNRMAIKQQNKDALQHLISACCRFKAEIVRDDEKEQGVRALLNLGHTFGHAIENVSDYRYLHGEAVALGLVMAADLSVRLGHAEPELKAQFVELIEAFDLPHLLPNNYSPEQLLNAMRLDKKVQSGQHRLILMRGMGRAFVANDIAEKVIIETIRACSEGDSHDS